MSDKNEKTREELRRKSELTTGMTEFVISIDMHLEAPVVNTGCIMSVTDADGNTRLWIVVNMEEFGPFIPADGLAAIRTALAMNNKKSVEKVKNVCATAFCVPLVHAITMDMIRSGEAGEMIVALHLKDAYLKNTHNRLCGQEIDYALFAARCHVYLNSYPAGLGAGTSIEMMSNKFDPHMIPLLKPENRAYLFDLIPKRREFKLVVGTNQLQFNARPELYSFRSDVLETRSALAATVTKFLATYENQNKKLVEALKPRKK